MSDKTYPDVTDLLKRYEQGRIDNAALSFGEKMAILEALRDRLAPFRELRERNDAQAAADHSPKP